MAWLILFSSLLGFLITLVVTPKITQYLIKINVIVKDMNKKDKPLVPISGGLGVATGFFIGIMLYLFINTFFYEDTENLTFLLAAVLSILIITLIGFIDDLSVKLGEKGIYLGLKQWQKPLLTLFAAIPLMVINAGTSVVSLPFFGQINLGIIYALILVPVGVVGASNMVNLLAGFNGVEAGMGIIYTGMLGLFAYLHGGTVAAVIAFITFGSLIAFFIYNKYPAKILPGDSLTYLLGAVMVSIAILGNIEKAALIASIPFFVEFVLKFRGKFKKQSYGYWKNGKIQSLYKKIYSIHHFFTITGKFTEKQITYFSILIELFFCSLIWFL